MEPAAAWQGQTDSFLASYKDRVCGNDYTSLTLSKGVRNLFARPNATPGGDPRPVFVAINGVANSPSHAQWQVLFVEYYDGGGGIDFSARIAAWRALIDSVRAPAPRLMNPLVSNGTFQFTLPGQRGRTNRVEFTKDFLNWTPITNVFGTNAPVVIRDTNSFQDDRRFYRVVRP
jgi:hypothetical protein